MPDAFDWNASHRPSGDGRACVSSVLEYQHARGRRATIPDLLLRPPGRLFSMLVLRGGWRDGAAGVVIAVLASISVAAKYAQLWARRKSRDE